MRLRKRSSLSVTDLASDLLPEILLWLPAKSLIRFKSVCKEWLSLISSDNFCHQHTLRHPKLQQSLLLEGHISSLFYFNPTGERLMIPYKTSVPGHQILQACNGLVLLGSSSERCRRGYDVYDPDTSYYVYNPTTRRSRKITLTYNDEYPYVAAIGLAFDPSESPYYKIVCIRTTSEPSLLPHLVEVYDSEFHTWKLSLALVKLPSYPRGVYWNNSIYWISNEGYYESYECFDIAKDEMRTLLSPQYQDSLYQGIKDVAYYLQESNGHLFHYELMSGFEFVSVAVWELGGDDRSEWLLRHHHVLHPHPPHELLHPPMEAEAEVERSSFPKCILGLMEGEGTRSLLICGIGTIRAYNFLDKSYDDLVDITSQPFYTLEEYRLGLIAHQFGESLALV